MIVMNHKKIDEASVFVFRRR